MSGESDLSVLLRSAKPEHTLGNYVFCQVPGVSGLDVSKCVMMFKEREAITLVLTQEQADEWSLAYSSVFAWITLTPFVPGGGGPNCCVFYCFGKAEYQL